MSHFNPAEPLLAPPDRETTSQKAEEALALDHHHPDHHHGEHHHHLERIRNLSRFRRVFRSIQKGSMRGVVVIFIRLCLGAGIFTLPFYVKSYGYVLGGLLILLAGVLNLLSYYDIVEVAEEGKATNYFDMIRQYLGDGMLHVFKVTYFFDLSATVIAVFVVCYKLLQFCMGFLGLVRPEWVLNPATGEWREYHPQVLQIRGFFFLAVLVLSVPFLLQKELFLLQKVNYVVLLALVLLIGYILAECPFFYAVYKDETTREAVKGFDTDWFENFFALMLSFYAQPYVFSLKSELIAPTVARLKKATRITMTLEVVIFIVVGIVGYLALGEKFTPDMLYARQAYPDKNGVSEWVYRGVLIFYFVCVLVGLSVYNPTIREAIYDLFPRKIEGRLFYGVTSILPFVLYALVAFAKPSVVFIFNLTGVTVSNFNGFILPAVIQAVRHKRAGHHSQMAIPIVKAVLFAVFGGIGLYFMIRKM